MITGHLPFDNDDIEIVANKITKHELNFRSNIYKDSSFLALDLVDQMLNKKPSLRPNMKQILNHEWIMETRV